MCLIIASPLGKTTSLEVLQYAFDSNPHGWGVMRSDGLSVQVDKGMSLDGLLDAVERANGLPHVIHLRYATHGPKNRKNTHPFKIRDGLFVAHNGILDIQILDKSRSDTFHYAQWLSSYLAVDPDFYDSPDFTAVIGKDIGYGNKFAFLEASGDIKIVNETCGFWHDEQWYSNDYSLPSWFGFEDIEPEDETLNEFEVEFTDEYWERLEEKHARQMIEESMPEELTVSRYREYSRL